MCSQKFSKQKIKRKIGHKKIGLFLVKQVLLNGINY